MVKKADLVELVYMTMVVVIVFVPRIAGLVLIMGVVLHAVCEPPRWVDVAMITSGVILIVSLVLRDALRPRD